MNMNAAHSAGSSFQYPPSRYTTDLFIKSLFNFSLGNLLGIWLDLWPIFIRFWNYLRLILVSITRIHGFPKSKLISYVWSVGCAAKRLFMEFCLHCIKYLILNTCQWDIFSFKHFSQMYQYYDGFTSWRLCFKYAVNPCNKSHSFKPSISHYLYRIYTLHLFIHSSHHRKHKSVFMFLFSS